MKRKIALFLALAMLAAVSVIALPVAAEEGEPSEADKEAAQKVADLIDAIYVQTRTDETDAQCAAAKAAWDGRGGRSRLLWSRHRRRLFGRSEERR